MEKWEDFLRNIIRTIGVTGVIELEKALSELQEEAKKPWQKAILNMACDLLAENGIDGIKMIELLVDKIIGGEVPDLSFASLRDRSDYLAAIQNMESDERSKVRDFLNKMGYSLGVIVRSIVSGIFGSV